LHPGGKYFSLLEVDPSSVRHTVVSLEAVPTEKAEAALRTLVVRLEEMGVLVMLVIAAQRAERFTAQNTQDAPPSCSSTQRQQPVPEKSGTV